MTWLNNLTIGQIIGSLIAIAAVISSIIEVSSVFKSQPITDILRWIGSKLNAQTNEQVKELKDRVEKIEKVNAENEAVNRRIRILQFGDEIRRGINHSYESYVQILDDIGFYSNYCLEHPDFKNARTIMTTEKIEEMYKMHMTNNDFL